MHVFFVWDKKARRPDLIRSFKKQYGLSPSQYRRVKQAGAPVPEAQEQAPRDASEPKEAGA